MKTFCTICMMSLTDWSVVSGVYPVIRKWRRGVGMRDAIRPIRSLFM